MNAIFDTFPVSTDSVTGAVELVEYGDALCYGSQHIRKAICNILDQFQGQPFTYSYRHYPNPANDQSLLAAMATEAAKRQGKFWLMHNALFIQPLINCSVLAALASALELDLSRFLHDLVDDSLYDLIKTDWRIGYQLGVRYPPTLFIGGQLFHGKPTQARLAPIVQSHLSHFRLSVLNTVDQKSGVVHWGGNEFG
ncbi:DsbA family protein [Spirosoma validum]|uniref:Thioredoxin domain-containing protein n=1 Tax=Spirosoma validum TaxID=2771355 RepID=A0A927B7Q5_9BACT|nr:thioredoxin domain-containing protein [Spirosoma validum]MBD2757250.1 thioredoxin domain-containing protein [Spirosoma validum]